MAYTYLIGWSTHNKYYYGVRYARGCTPSDLWKTYFTSSKHVKKMYEEHGDPDIIEIRKIFDSAEKALDWENKVLKRMNVVGDNRFINQTNNKAISREAALRGLKNRPKEKQIPALYRKWYDGLSEIEKDNIRKAKQKGMLNKSEEAAKSQSEGIRKYQLEAWSNPEIKEKKCKSMRKPKSKIECPHCGKIGGSNNMKRWHFDNCKVKL